MDKESLLSEIGLSDKETKTYLAILELGSSTIKPIALRSGIKRTSIYNFIDRLVELGLITQTVVRGRTHYQALPPSHLADLQRERLHRVESILPELTSLFNLNSSKPRMHYYEGPEQMKNIVREELSCTKEALYIWPSAESTEMIGGKRFMTDIDKQRIERGVRIRTIRMHDQTEHLFETSAHGTALLREVRFAPENENYKMGMGIYDTGNVSFFSSKEEGFGILIESKELSAMLRSLFELLWQVSTPAKPGQG
ncbi:MAG: helix-turn-helix domain-containing protein [bacterium]